MYRNYIRTGVISLSFLFLYHNHQKNTVELFYEKNSQNEQRLNSCPSLYNYKPTLYLNGFLQTIVACIIPKDNKIISEKEYIGNSGISVDWVSKNENDKSLLIILPGLTGRVQSTYINQTIQEGLRQNFKNICVYNYRMMTSDCNYFFVPEDQDFGLTDQLKEDFRQIQHGKEQHDHHYMIEECVEGQRIRVDLHADLHHTLKYIKDKYKLDRVVALGCSYGATQMCGYLGRFSESAHINAAVSICAPYTIIRSNENLSFGMDLVLTSLLKRRLASIRHIFDQQRYPCEWDVDIEGALKTWTIKDFDELFSSKVYGYKSADSYYRHFSPVNWLGNIKVPLLCIQSLDDGACSFEQQDKQEILRNPQAILCTTGLGGHVGFLEGLIPKQAWFPKPSLEFLKQFI